MILTPEKKDITYLITIIFLIILAFAIFIAGIHYAQSEKGTITKIYPTIEKTITNNSTNTPTITIEKKGTCISIHEPNATSFDQKCYLN